MDLEHRLTTMLGESVHDLPVPVAVMVAEAGRRGRRLRLRRRVLQLASTVAVVTGLALGSSTLIDLRSHAAAPSVARPAGPGILGTLAALLPSGASLRQVELPADPAAGAELTVVYEDGQSRATVTVTLYGPHPHRPRPACEDRTDCTVTRTADGTEQLTEIQGSPAGGGYDIRVTRPGGAEIRLTVHRDTPAPAASLTLAQWQGIARSPDWVFPLTAHQSARG